MINILINLEFIHPASPFFSKIVETQRESMVSSKDEIRLANLTFNRVLICSFWQNTEVWIVTDRNEVITDIDGNGLNDIPFTVASYVYVAFQIAEGNFQCARVSNAHGVPYGISVGDFNQDNRPDLAFAEANEMNVYTLTNNGALNFTEELISTGIRYPNHLAVRNIDTDPIPEIVFTDEGLHNESGRLYVYDFSTNSTSIINYECMEGLSLADINNDGRRDIVCTASNFLAINSGYLKYQLNQGNSWSQTYNVSNLQRTWHSVTTGDFNKDGRVDIAACTADDNSIYVFFNNGDNPPTFSLVTSVFVSEFNACEIKAADIDCDGDHDIIWTHGFLIPGPSVGYLENPTWTNYVIESGTYTTYGVVVGYVNNDKKPDVIVGLNNGLYVYYNTSNIDTTLCEPITPVDIGENKSLNYSIITDKGRVKVLFNTSIDGRIEVHSIDGSKVVSKEFSGKEVNLNLKRGLYIISIKSDLLTKKEKITIY